MNNKYTGKTFYVSSEVFEAIAYGMGLNISSDCTKLRGYTNNSPTFERNPLFEKEKTKEEKKMTRHEALEKVNRVSITNFDNDVRLLASLEALGLLKFEEEKKV